MKYRNSKPSSSKWRFIQFFFILSLLVALGLIVGLGRAILGDDVKQGLEHTLGEVYINITAFVLILCVLLLIYLAANSSALFLSDKSTKLKSLSIPWGITNEEYLFEAEYAVQESRLERAIELLFKIDSQDLNEEVNLLASRLARLKIEERQGTLNDDSRYARRNIISRDILVLISEAEKSLQTEGVINSTIRSYLLTRYEKRLSQKLAGRQPINLCISQNSLGTSKEISNYFITLHVDEIEGEIKKVYEQAKCRLLITGAPGAGKTVVMLQLVLSLLKENKKNTLPVLLNLATWQSSFVKLEVWLEEILPSELGVSKALGKKILHEYPLILLLDGLDEVNEADRISCLNAIGKIGVDARNSFVIASRQNEYSAIQKDAPVNLQVEISPLKINQIEQEIDKKIHDQPENLTFLSAIQTDSDLKEIVKTPFYLNVLQLLFSSRTSLSDLDLTTHSVEGKQKEIIWKFINTYLNESQKWDRKKALECLSFLASRMSQQNLVVFELRDLQYHWWGLPSRITRFGIGLVSGLVSSLIKGIVIGLVLGVFISLVMTIALSINKTLTIPVSIAAIMTIAAAMAFVIASILFGGFDEAFAIAFRNKTLPVIETKSRINWSWKSYWVNVQNEIMVILAGGLLLSLVTGLTIVLGGLTGLHIISLILFLVVFPFLFLMKGLIDLLDNDYLNLLQINGPYQRFYASMWSLHFSILQHFHLRYLLYKKGLIPWKLVDFLNDMTKQHILESDGGTWRFRHRIIQDHFTELWEEEYRGKRK